MEVYQKSKMIVTLHCSQRSDGELVFCDRFVKEVCFSLTSGLKNDLFSIGDEYPEYDH